MEKKDAKKQLWIDPLICFFFGCFFAADYVTVTALASGLRKHTQKERADLHAESHETMSRSGRSE